VLLLKIELNRFPLAIVPNSSLLANQEIKTNVKLLHNKARGKRRKYVDRPGALSRFSTLYEKKNKHTVDTNVVKMLIIIHNTTILAASSSFSDNWIAAS
jgi:hypothetical protein